jgi:hypothetical protein
MMDRDDGIQQEIQQERVPGMSILEHMETNVLPLWNDRLQPLLVQQQYAYSMMLNQQQRLTTTARYHRQQQQQQQENANTFDSYLLGPPPAATAIWTPLPGPTFLSHPSSSSSSFRAPWFLPPYF